MNNSFDIIFWLWLSKIYVTISFFNCVFLPYLIGNFINTTYPLNWIKLKSTTPDWNQSQSTIAWISIFSGNGEIEESDESNRVSAANFKHPANSRYAHSSPLTLILSLEDRGPFSSLALPFWSRTETTVSTEFSVHSVLLWFFSLAIFEFWISDLDGYGFADWLIDWSNCWMCDLGVSIGWLCRWLAVGLWRGQGMGRRRWLSFWLGILRILKFRHWFCLGFVFLVLDWIWKLQFSD